MKFKDFKNYILLHSFVNRPIFFNSLRYLVTGNQKSLKDFVRKTLKTYHCRSVLDICCGTGDFVQNNKFDYVGIDINPGFIVFAQRKYGNENVKFICGNALNLPFSSKKFDASLLVSTLHHFSDQEVKILLEEAGRVTKKVVIIVDLIPSVNYLKRFFVMLDQGSFVRKEKEKEILVSQFFKIQSTGKLFAGLAEQYGIVAEVYQFK